MWYMVPGTYLFGTYPVAPVFVYHTGNGTKKWYILVLNTVYNIKNDLKYKQLR